MHNSIVNMIYLNGIFNYFLIISKLCRINSRINKSHMSLASTQREENIVIGVIY